MQFYKHLLIWMGKISWQSKASASGMVSCKIKKKNLDQWQCKLFV